MVRAGNSDWAAAISDAARIVFARFRVRAHFDLELSDLVQIGWERVLRYMSPDASRVLVFVCAKQGMMREAKTCGAMAGNRKLQHGRPDAVPFDDEDGGSLTFWRRATPPLPIEEMIDAKRALLALPLPEAYSWMACDVVGHDLEHAAGELARSPSSVRCYLRQARQALGMATDGKWGVVAQSGTAWGDMDDAERRELIRMRFDEGLTWRQLAERTGHNVFWLRRVLRTPAVIAKC